MCPSDPEGGRGGINSYYGCYGTTTDIWNVASTGMFSHKSAYGIRDAIDGSSNTIAWGEALINNTITPFAKWRGGVTPSASQAGGGPFLDANASIASVMTDLATCNTSWAGNPAGNNKGWRWGTGSPGIANFNTIVTPNSNLYTWSACRFGCVGCGNDYAQYITSSSNHSGGVNACMADGSVRFIKNSISMSVWWAIGTRANGEVIGSDQY